VGTAEKKRCGDDRAGDNDPSADQIMTAKMAAMKVTMTAVTNTEYGRCG
jgi:hypothetical protein